MTAFVVTVFHELIRFYVRFILSRCYLLCFFKRVSIELRVINAIASSSLASEFCQPQMYPNICHCWLNSSYHALFLGFCSICFQLFLYCDSFLWGLAVGVAFTKGVHCWFLVAMSCGWLWDSWCWYQLSLLLSTQYLQLHTTQDARHWRSLVNWNCSYFPVSSSLQSSSLEVRVLHHSLLWLSSACVEPPSLAVPLIPCYGPVVKSASIWWDSDSPTHVQLHLIYSLFPSCKHPSGPSILPPASI